MALNHHQQSPRLLPDSLYCSEENWGEEIRRDIPQEQEQEESCCLSCPFSTEKDLFWEDDELAALLSKEEQNQLYETLEANPNLAVARQEAVDWVLKVNACYSFSALTALLAVNYLDRFLFCFHSQSDKPWMTQLAAVACLSLAAKMEETQVPLLLDLQVGGSKYVFEARTIQRMEILVLSTLQWKMNPVTPISFLDYFARRLSLKGNLCWEFLRRCESILLCVISDLRFTCHLSSVMAISTMLLVVNTIEPKLKVEFQDQILGILGMEKKDHRVEDCFEMVMELAPKCQSFQTNKRKFWSVVPGSPNGVVDASFISDSSNESWAVASPASSSQEPLSKKSRAQEHHLLETLNHG